MNNTSKNTSTRNESVYNSARAKNENISAPDIRIIFQSLADLHLGFHKVIQNWAGLFVDQQFFPRSAHQMALPHPKFWVLMTDLSRHLVKPAQFWTGFSQGVDGRRRQPIRHLAQT